MTRLADTDLWYRTYDAPEDTRTTYLLSPNDSLVAWDAQTWQPDPLNPQRFVLPGNADDPEDQDFSLSILELPDAPVQPWIKPNLGMARGQLSSHQLSSPGRDMERRLWSYTPPGYDSDRQTYPLLILLDGRTYVQTIPTPTLLNNLISAAVIPPLVTIMVDTSVNRVTDLQCSLSLTDFLVTELLPWIRQHYSVSHDPQDVIVGGFSAGALAAAFAGWQHPELFGKVLAQSGAFWWSPESEGEAEWLTRQFAETPTRPLRYSITAGRLETSLPIAGPSLLVANRHLRTVL